MGSSRAVEEAGGKVTKAAKGVNCEGKEDDTLLVKGSEVCRVGDGLGASGLEFAFHSIHVYLGERV